MVFLKLTCHEADQLAVLARERYEQLIDEQGVPPVDLKAAADALRKLQAARARGVEEPTPTW